jgi:hypothetical protein
LQVVSGAQIRAARGLLGMSSRELAAHAQVSWATIKRFEDSPAIPSNRGGTLARVKETLEAAGARFLGDPIRSPGVRLVSSRKAARA